MVSRGGFSKPLWAEDAHTTAGEVCLPIHLPWKVVHPCRVLLLSTWTVDELMTLYYRWGN